MADHVVYLAYDIGDRLLYVGMTSDWNRRSREHRNASAWWPKVARVAFEQLPSRQAAFGHEQALIRRHRPPYNLPPGRRSPHRRSCCGWCNDACPIDRLPEKVARELAVSAG